MIIDMGYCAKVVKRLIVFILTCIGIFLAFKLALFYIPFLIAFIISMLIEPIIKLLNNNTNLERKTCAIIVFIFTTIILVTLLSFGIITIISESANLLQGLNGYIEKTYNSMQDIFYKFDLKKINILFDFTNIFNSSSQELLDFISEWVRGILGNILQIISKLPAIFIYIGITFISTYFICTDKLYILDQIEHHLPRTWATRLMLHFKKIVSSLGSYLKAECILVGISFLITLIRVIYNEFHWTKC